MSHVDDGTLHAYLDGELSPPEAQAVEAHVAQCPACRTRLEEERALIARAGELLARAAPPDRELPPFRPGDVKPPARLWWQVRTPVAWAATIALALGIGTYVGGYGVRRTPPTTPTEVADRLAENATAAALARTRDSEAVLKHQRASERRGRVSQHVGPQAPVPALDERRQEESIPQASADSTAIRGSNALAARESPPLVAGGRRMAAKTAAPEPARLQMMRRVDGGYVITGGPIGLDSARMLLGQEPVVLPDVPIQAIYQGRMIGYSGMVIIEQALDSATILEVINGRAAPLALQAVVVTGAATAQADSQSPRARALLNARVADSLEAVSRPAPAPTAKKMERPQAASGLFVDVRGHLSADSLAALRRLLRPLRP